MSAPRAGIIMGSGSDLRVMRGAADALRELGVASEMTVVSAHRTPRRMFRYASTAEQRGLSVIVAGAGGAAHLPGMVASLNSLPVIGVPITTTPLQGLDALLSIAQMPGGVPVATVGVDNGRNAGLLAARIDRGLGSHRARRRGPPPGANGRRGSREGRARGGRAGSASRRGRLVRGRVSWGEAWTAARSGSEARASPGRRRRRLRDG